jgi:quercetin dioxygenase-like cupin family protein
MQVLAGTLRVWVDGQERILERASLTGVSPPS